MVIKVSEYILIFFTHFLTNQSHTTGSCTGSVCRPSTRSLILAAHLILYSGTTGQCYSNREAWPMTSVELIIATVVILWLRPLHLTLQEITERQRETESLPRISSSCAGVTRHSQVNFCQVHSWTQTEGVVRGKGNQTCVTPSSPKTALNFLQEKHKLSQTPPEQEVPCCHIPEKIFKGNIWSSYLLRLQVSLRHWDSLCFLSLTLDSLELLVKLLAQSVSKCFSDSQLFHR